MYSQPKSWLIPRPIIHEAKLLWEITVKTRRLKKRAGSAYCYCIDCIHVGPRCIYADKLLSYCWKDITLGLLYLLLMCQVVFYIADSAIHNYEGRQPSCRPRPTCTIVHV